MKIFLDDVRTPQEAYKYMIDKLGLKAHIYLNEWVVVRNYEEFKAIITHNHKSITDVSFDHDLAVGHYHKNMQEGIINYNAADFDPPENKTGYHCAKWMKDYYMINKLKFPEIYIHSMNPVGITNIINVFK